jgi:actin-related protein
MLNNKIVIDHGSYSTKYGYAGYDKPEGLIRSLIIKDGYESIVDIEESFIKGFEGMEIEYPIKNGYIMNYDLMENIWDEIFYNKLKIDPKISSILITEQSNTPNKTRDIIKEIMFEKYGFNQIQFCNQQVVSLYGSGRSTGIVLDIGHDITRCVPVYDSLVINNGSQFSGLAGKRFNNHICNYHNFKKKDDEMDIYKRKYFKTEKNKLYRNYFIDQLDNIDCLSLSDLINKSIQQSDIDLRKDLAKNIVMVGGTSKIPGLCKDIYNSLNKYDNLKYKITASKNRDISAWLGGSILSGIPTFNNMWIKKN